jgi:hypothetical protein
VTELTKTLELKLVDPNVHKRQKFCETRTLTSRHSKRRSTLAVTHSQRPTTWLLSTT